MKELKQKLLKKFNLIYKESNWKSILLSIFNENSHMKPLLLGKKLEMPNIGPHYFAYNHNLENPKFKSIIIFLINHNLIEKDSSKINSLDKKLDFYVLSHKGFNVALELQKNKSQNIHNWIIIILTFVLTFSSILQIFF